MPPCRPLPSPVDRRGGPAVTDPRLGCLKRNCPDDHDAKYVVLNYVAAQPRLRRCGSRRYGSATGSRTSTVVPWPGIEPTSSEPPTGLARSRIPARPKWSSRSSWAPLLASKPTPSSRARLEDPAEQAPPLVLHGDLAGQSLGAGDDQQEHEDAARGDDGHLDRAGRPAAPHRRGQGRSRSASGPATATGRGRRGTSGTATTPPRGRVATTSASSSAGTSRPRLRARTNRRRATVRAR
jgi:hypothetical protein